MPRSKLEARKRRKLGIRQRIRGTNERPRVTVYRSLNHLYVQVIDDGLQRTLVQVSTLGKGNSEAFAGLSKTDKAKKVGAMLAGVCKERGIKQVVFDRNGYKYHGRVKALAASAREGGLEF